MGGQFTLETSGGSEIVGFTPDAEKSRVDNVLDELDAYYRSMKEFNDIEATEVLQALSSFSARASEIRSQLQRVDSKRSYALRTKHIDPFIEECDRQFKIHSRIQSIRETDYKLARGQF